MIDLTQKEKLKGFRDMDDSHNTLHLDFTLLSFKTPVIK